MSSKAAKWSALIACWYMLCCSANAYSPPGAPVLNAPDIVDRSANPSQGAMSEAAPKRMALVPDTYKEASDGLDDAPSIQRAIDAACAGTVKTLAFYARRYKINSPVTQNCTANWEGQGFEEQPGSNTAASGTWFDIGAGFSGTFASPINLAAGAGSVFENFGVAEPSQPTPPSASYDPLFPAGSASPRILGYTLGSRDKVLAG